METIKDEITIVLGIFSGRENPVMTLTSDVATRFIELLRGTIGKETVPPPSPARLGDFYGFIVRLPRELAERFSIPSELNVRGAVVTQEGERQPRHWRDVSGVEAFLIDQATKSGYGELLRKVGIKH